MKDRQPTEGSTLHLGLHGLELAFSGPQAILSAVAARLGQLPPGTKGEPDLQFSYRIVDRTSDHLRFDRRSGMRPFYNPSAGEALYSPEDDICFLSLDTRASAVFRPQEGLCTISLLAPERERTWIAAHPLLTLPLLEMLKRRDLFFVHAAAVARDGRCMLLPGNSGSGKSTLSILMLQAGFAFMGDDIALLDGRDARRVLAFPERIGATGQTMSFFPQASTLTAAPERGYPKHEILSSTFSSRSPCWEATPAALVFPSISSDQTSLLMRIGSDEALSLLAPNLLLTHTASTQHHLDALTSIAARVAAFQLQAGRDFHRIPTLLGELLQ